ncbi:MAG: alpha/beta hydrolase [Sphingomonas adhaesiva]|uniref:alpha/beta fold hydrolase n=1 Tax=Sphingomonas adhaesiva TaxID=28212 RepID=UPI002FF6CB69
MTTIVTGTTTNQVPFARVGERPTMVVLNGGQGFVRQSSPERLERDARRMAKVLPRGRSFVLLNYRPDPPAGLSIDDVTFATSLAVAETAPDQPLDLIGVSYGGMVACRLAAARPAAFRRMVLLASGERFSPAGAAHIARQIACLEAGDVTGFTRAFGRLFRRRPYNWLMTAMIRLGGDRVARGMAPGPSIVRYLTAMLEAPRVELARISTPTLVIGGARDQFFGDGSMEETAAAIPGADLRAFADETHMAPIEIADAVAKEITLFLGDPDDVEHAAGY